MMNVGGSWEQDKINATLNNREEELIWKYLKVELFLESDIFLCLPGDRFCCSNVRCTIWNGTVSVFLALSHGIDWTAFVLFIDTTITSI